MEHDPTGCFSSRVEDYVRYRPSYPREVATVLERECGLKPECAIADIGSGTGLLAALFLDLGCEISGVEPNAEMRRAGERILSGFARFHSVDGRAEDTGLPDRSFDFITAGQAFHWFDPAAARREFSRILKPEGWVVLVWNERLVGTDAFLNGYEALLHKYAPEYAQVDHRRVDDGAIASFYGNGGWRFAKFDNRQEFDWDGVRGRLRSSSYAPREGSAAYEGLMRELEQLFWESQRKEHIQFLYETKMYYGPIGC